MAAPVKVLSIDGGGIRGVIPATVLVDVERRTARPASELFDLIVGTSTGGIIALGLTKPDDHGRPAWSAADLVSLYRREGAHIFSRSVWQRIETAEGVLDEKYPASGLERALERYFGESRLSAALAPVMVTSYDLERRRPFFFRSGRAAADPAYDFPMREAARATSAAPTYFEPPRLRNDATGERFALVDGGVFANNPAMTAYAEVLAERRDVEVLMLSLGTGQLTRPIPYEHARHWGLLGWARPILDVVLDGVSDTTDYELEQLLGPESHIRIQTELDRGSDDLDDATPANIATLEEKATEMIAAHDAELDRVCTLLRG
jgi:patatin-like phospholipase/acyl hydrolase